MLVSRNLSLPIQRVLDHWIPPALRDSRWFMYLPMRLVLGERARDYRTFKQTVFDMDATEFGELYRRTAATCRLRRETDLNARCIERVLAAVSGPDVLEVGCGRGLLAGLLSARHQVTACDIVIGPDLPTRYPSVTFVHGNVESLPFDDAAFDTVVCTHTLEHVQNLHRAIAELRRVARHQLIVVVPRQRPYRYHFDLHVHFFPYAWSLKGAFGHRDGAVISDLGDWYYEETRAAGGEPAPAAPAARERAAAGGTPFRSTVRPL